MQTTINSFLEDLSKNPRWNHLKGEVRRKLNAELARLKGSIGQSAWQTAEKNYNQIIKKLNVAQKQIDQEVQKTLKSIKKSATDIEKTLAQYKAASLKNRVQPKRAAPSKKKIATKVSNRPSTARKRATKI